MAWTITSPLTAGPLGSNSYNYPITGLTPSTKYCYQAYFIVDGVSYYGNILTGTTAAIPLVAPTVNTGLAGSVTSSSFIVNGNNVQDKGGAPVIEYGILYTQSGTWSFNLTYENVDGVNVKKTSVFGDIAISPVTYSASTSGLAALTTTYYRAFAKTAAGIGYGEVENIATAAAPAPPSVQMLYIYGAENNDVIDACNAGELSAQSGTYTASISWRMYKGELTGGPYPITVQVYCDGALKHSVTCSCKAISANWLYGSSGVFPSFSVTPSNTVVVCVCAETELGAAMGSCATGTLSSASPYGVAAQRSITAYTCGAFGAPVLPDFDIE